MKNIFIIDDDAVYQMVLKRGIKKINPDISIISYWNGDEALTAVKELISESGSFPCLALLDINMPVLDGWQFLEELEKLQPDIGNKLNIYMISTSLDSGDREKALRNKNVKDLLTKPLSQESLKNLLLTN